MSRDNNPFNAPPVTLIPFHEIRSVVNNLSLAGATSEQIISGLAASLVCVLLCRAQELEGGGAIAITLPELGEASQEAVNAIGDRLGISVPT